MISSVTHNTENLYNALVLKEALEHLDLSALPDDIKLLQKDLIITDAIRKVELGLQPIYSRPTLLGLESNSLK